MTLTQDEVAVIVAAQERRREVARDALECVMSGASMADADALLDAIDDLGGRLECEP